MLPPTALATALSDMSPIPGNRRTASFRDLTGGNRDAFGTLKSFCLLSTQSYGRPQRLASARADAERMPILKMFLPVTASTCRRRRASCTRTACASRFSSEPDFGLQGFPAETPQRGHGTAIAAVLSGGIPVLFMRRGYYRQVGACTRALNCRWLWPVGRRQDPTGWMLHRPSGEAQNGPVEGLRRAFQTVSTRLTMNERTHQLLNRTEVCERTGLSYSTIWRREREGDFPARRRISANRVAWVESEVERWIEERQKVAWTEALGGGAT